MSSEDYSTKDVWLCSYLMVKGHQVVNVTRDDSNPKRRYIFWIDQRPNDTVLNAFFQRQARVNMYDLVQKYHKVIGLMYAYERDER